jgi:hypothetical protein
MLRLASLACLAALAAAAEKDPGVSSSVQGATTAWSKGAPGVTIDTFFGYNLGDHAAKVGPWADPAFLAGVAALRPSTLRFPSGTAANYWDWKQGCENSPKPNCKNGASTLELFAPSAIAANSTVVFVLNIMTDTLTSQLAFLARAEALGLPVRFVELGNELYNNDADYVAAFPTGKDYGATASKWLAAIRAVYPRAAMSVVGVPSYRSGNNPRTTSWNSALFGSFVGGRQGDGVTMHEYDATGVSGTTFGKADVGTMLATPFATQARIAAAIPALPAWASVWITEYNLLYSASKPDVPAFGTWAHGLYVTTESILFANTPRIASGRINRHCTLGYADDGALFEDTTSFDFDMSPDKTLVTVAYGLSAAGASLSLFGNASYGMSSAAPIIFSPNPTLKPGNYPSLVGTLFAGDRGTSAIVVNLASAPFHIAQANVTNFAHFQQLSVADATTPINNAARDLTSTSGAVPSGGLDLPAYSVTVLF